LSHIQPAGRRILRAVDAPLERALIIRLAQLGPKRLRQLVTLLEAVREAADV